MGHICDVQLFEASLRTPYTLSETVYRALRAGVFEHDVSLSETELRAAKPNFHRGRLAPALESRGKSGSPPKKVSEGQNVRRLLNTGIRLVM